ncbi:DUF721 domain-containing protein [Chitinasiproducens palmae]|uniref:DUF721 domain-containing protein n=1 Tax=Chitinasiproducens palmae TaxID=1770053 RepID=A0A1H2PTK0_9BURK|nr:DUF721 domain-containing protein [Chitinasiproducens palmae]SDV49580.1 Protein of unknown function [Chitinasiproducens palmae]
MSRQPARPATARRPTARRASKGAAKTIGEALAGNDFFAGLRAGIARRGQMTEHLDEILPGYLRGHVAPASIREGTLVLLARHNALAARLRHLEPQLVAALASRGWAVRALRVRIAPLPPVPAPPAKQAHLSATALACLESLTHELEPSTLRDALARIVARHPKSR